MSLTTNHFDRGKPFYPIVVNYVSQLVGFKELIVRGLTGPQKLDEVVVQALELLGVSYASPPERNLIGEQLNKLMGPLELRSEYMGNHITVDIDWIACEFVDNWSYLLHHTMLAAASVVVLAHEGAKGKPWHHQGPLWEFLRHCRNAASHGGSFNFVNGEPRWPAHWGSLHTLQPAYRGRLSLKARTEQDSSDQAIRFGSFGILSKRIRGCRFDARTTSKSVLQQTVVSPHELDLITFVDHYCDRRTMGSFLSRRSLLQLSALAAMSGKKAKAASPRPSRAARPAQTGAAGSAPLQTKGLFMHAWDLKDSGADTVMAWMRDSDLNQMTIAGCYHSGWFVHPHNPRHRAYMTEGSVAYFHPDKKIFKSSPIKPAVASFAKDTNWLTVAGKLLDKYQLQMVSWTIGTHNTHLAQKYPEYAQQNVYGDAIPHALSIGHDATRGYLKALCRDLAVNYPMYGIQLESFGWMGLRHGHHHERDLTGLSSLEQDLLAMCFSAQTVNKAKEAGIDADKAREVVKATLEAAFKQAPDRPKGHPASMSELESQAPDLKAYNRFRQQLADSMIVEIKQEALKGTSCKLLLQSGYQKEVAHVADGFASGVYGKLPAEVLKIVGQGRARIPADWKGDYPCFVRLGMGVPASQEQLREIVLALKNAGSTGPIFYNYSESPVKMLGWIEGALEGL